ncbi:MAG: saccharopine dehydrogenase NADP-binding domain-containing protein [Nitrospira sp.]|nr:saccharopine dehydrogenase NADP-binding domain-containing protein [Nitrospira sp.]
MKVFVLGVGATGSLLVKLLARQGHHVLCGDRDPVRAREFLGAKSPIAVQQVNARNLRSIVKAAGGCHLLINACPAVFNNIVMRAALSLGAHYLDTASHLRADPFRPEQFHFDQQFRKNKQWALIHAGAAPGLTNLFAVQAAAQLDRVDKVEVRIFEETASDAPVSQWSAESSFDEAVSRPRIYREGRFRYGPRFGERELFRFPGPIGRVGVVLAAQDEVVTIPRTLGLKQMDAKIGGMDIDRLRRWYRQGKLRQSRRLSPVRFPATPTPAAMTTLVQEGILHNERFALAVLVYGDKQGRSCLIRWDAQFPSMFELRRRRISSSPIAWGTAHLTTLFVKCMPHELTGVYVPEALPATARRNILQAVRRSGIRLTRKVTSLTRE